MANEEEDRMLAGSKEMSKFFRVLATLNANVMYRVNSENSAKAKIEAAASEMKDLLELVNGARKCPPGTIWDESLRRCVPLE